VTEIRYNTGVASSKAKTVVFSSILFCSHLFCSHIVVQWLMYGIKYFWHLFCGTYTDVSAAVECYIFGFILSYLFKVSNN
jgi:hypothetical protein